MRRAVPYLAAAVGGGLGALARWGIQLGWPHPGGGWPWAVLLINLTGCLALGVLISSVFARHPDHPWLRALLGTGVLGGFTTFSTFTVDAVEMADTGHAVAAAGYVFASVGGGVLTAAAGLWLGGSRGASGTAGSRGASGTAEGAPEEDVA